MAVKQELEMDLGLPLVKRVIRKAVKLVVIARIKLRSRFTGEKLPFYCPCCKVHLKAFMDEGYVKFPELYNPARYAGLDQKVTCPCCGALPRHRILALWMEAHIEELRGKRILHFTQEGGLRSWMSRNGISATTADLHSPADLNLETVYEDASITDEEGRIKHFGQDDHLRIFGRDSASMLESFGFEVEEITSDDERIKPVIGPADYDYNVLWGLRKR